MPEPATPPDYWNGRYAKRADGMQASEIRELLKLLARTNVTSLAGGIPDPALFPVDEFRTAQDELLSDPESAGAALQYSPTEGFEPLRRWIAARMGSLGVPCDVENIAITSGSQQALDLLGKLFIGPGDKVLTQAPTYLGALQTFNAYEASYDEFGDPLPPAGAGQARVAFAYVVPDFANPTGESLSREAREQLLALTRDLDVPLVEDAAYQALRFDGAPIPSCLALDIEAVSDIERSRVIYCGSFSKILSPGFRIGWICGAKDLVRKVVLAKQGTDLHTPTLNQMVMHRVAERAYDKQISLSIVHYRRRRDAMLAALARHMPSGVTWTEPQGGMFIWLTLPSGMDGGSLLRDALDEGIAFVPGGAFFANGGGANTIRLNFSLPSPAQIEAAVPVLARLVRRGS
ncbi:MULTISPECIES: aminotransferase-like domain-containing protein [Roseomonadaceae]|uniref:PLP-dependent aminotransferase family protein n=1 Tax=Falsiroseomonas oleicola TaxID=2801474 RepID=A0ABS6HBK2_9PROT|nr:PLP-dependent aminotransferase family protein [Roseomonas oleicola]MBU8546110.1 PLP-dependent aminotransferase family protein [Roseomonas oleicola]